MRRNAVLVVLVVLVVLDVALGCTGRRRVDVWGWGAGDEDLRHVRAGGVGLTCRSFLPVPTLKNQG